MRDLAEGILYMHNKGIAHGDLKPENILIIKPTSTCPRVRVKISGMGISKKIIGDTISLTNGSEYGTQGWQRCKVGISQEDDLFCLGSILFFCLTKGKHAIRHDINDMSLINHIPGAVNLISGLLSADPESRPKAEKVIGYPLLFDSERLENFIYETKDRLQSEDKDSQLLKALDGLLKGEDWNANAKIDPDFLNERLEYRQRLGGTYIFNSVRDLFGLMRNCLEHYKDFGYDSRKLMSSREEVLTYFYTRFVELFVDVYDLIWEHDHGKKKKDLSAPIGILSPEDAKKIVKSFTKDQLLPIGCAALIRHPDVLEAVRAVADSDRVRHKLFVHGLAWETTTERLRQVFNAYGELDEANTIVITDENSGKSKGCGFVMFKHVDSAILALKEPNKKIDGRITVTQLAAAWNSSSSDVALRKIYVENVPFEISFDRLLAHFSKYGEIEEGQVGFDKQTGKRKCFAFFVYKTEEGANASLVDDPLKTIEGHQVVCKLAIDNKKQRLNAGPVGGMMSGMSNSGSMGMHLRNYGMRDHMGHQVVCKLATDNKKQKLNAGPVVGMMSGMPNSGSMAMQLPNYGMGYRPGPGANMAQPPQQTGMMNQNSSYASPMGGQGFGSGYGGGASMGFGVGGGMMSGMPNPGSMTIQMPNYRMGANMAQPPQQTRMMHQNSSYASPMVGQGYGSGYGGGASMYYGAGGGGPGEYGGGLGNAGGC